MAIIPKARTQFRESRVGYSNPIRRSNIVGNAFAQMAKGVDVIGKSIADTNKKSEIHQFNRFKAERATDYDTTFLSQLEAASKKATVDGITYRKEDAETAKKAWSEKWDAKFDAGGYQYITTEMRDGDLAKQNSKQDIEVFTKVRTQNRTLELSEYGKEAGKSINKLVTAEDGWKEATRAAQELKLDESPEMAERSTLSADGFTGSRMKKGGALVGKVIKRALAEGDYATLFNFLGMSKEAISKILKANDIKVKDKDGKLYYMNAEGKPITIFDPSKQDGKGASSLAKYADASSSYAAITNAMKGLEAKTKEDTAAFVTNAKNMITAITHGETVDPNSLDEAIKQIPGVFEANDVRGTELRESLIAGKLAQGHDKEIIQGSITSNAYLMERITKAFDARDPKALQELGVTDPDILNMFKKGSKVSAINVKLKMQSMLQGKLDRKASMLQDMGSMTYGVKVMKDTLLIDNEKAWHKARAAHDVPAQREALRGMKKRLAKINADMIPKVFSLSNILRISQVRCTLH